MPINRYRTHAYINSPNTVSRLRVPRVRLPQSPGSGSSAERVWNMRACVQPTTLARVTHTRARAHTHTRNPTTRAPSSSILSPPPRPRFRFAAPQPALHLVGTCSNHFHPVPRTRVDRSCVFCAGRIVGERVSWRASDHLGYADLSSTPKPRTRLRRTQIAKCGQVSSAPPSSLTPSHPSCCCARARLLATRYNLISF